MAIVSRPRDLDEHMDIEKIAFGFIETLMYKEVAASSCTSISYAY